MPAFHKQVIEPAEALKHAPELRDALNSRAWVYRYTHPDEGWVLAIATHAEPGSDKLSLGGFRIAPKERTDIPGFDPVHEAIDLGIGMEEKVYWSRLIRVGGPLAQRDFGRIVGGKCVLQPTPDARIGQAKDYALIDFAAACFNDCEATAGFHVTTGQDLGHGAMHDGRTTSLDYLNTKFSGSVVADTSKPTAEGNFHVMRGMLRGVGRELKDCTIGLIGCGNIGDHIARRALAEGAKVIGVELNAKRRAELTEAGAEMLPTSGKADLLRRPIDALVVNAAGGTLDSATIDAAIANERLAVVCGSENLAMPNPADAERLRAARKQYAPTELGGMMGYLTAVEQFLSRLEKKPFRIEDMFEASKRLEVAGYEAAQRVVEKDYAIGFEDAVKELYG